MGRGLDLFEFVYASRTRRSILMELSESGLPWGEIDGRSGAFEEEVMAMMEKGLVTVSGGELKLTAAGRAFSGMVEKMRGVSALLDEGGHFWRHRDLSAIPEPFVDRLHHLRESDFVRAQPGDLERAVDRICREVEDASRLSLIFPACGGGLCEELDSSLPGDCSIEALVPEGLYECTACSELFDDAEFRHRAFDLVLGVTDDSVFLSLPVREGGEPLFDHSAVLVSGSDEAVEWGRELFEHLWSEAQ